MVGSWSSKYSMSVDWEHAVTQGALFSLADQLCSCRHAAMVPCMQFLGIYGHCMPYRQKACVISMGEALTWLSVHETHNLGGCSHIRRYPSSAVASLRFETAASGHPGGRLRLLPSQSRQ